MNILEIQNFREISRNQPSRTQEIKMEYATRNLLQLLPPLLHTSVILEKFHSK